ncbi:MAG: phage tail tape measure protein [Acidobacteria bacterium]|nr:phage tail tape measure protein [Acidobacteriota bacterium]MCA1650785.1 phage tail tape measure protein [Acidobacteriota bacterium]
MTGAIATLNIGIKTLWDHDSLTRGMEQTEKTLTKMGGQMKSVGAGLTSALTLPLVAVGGAAIAAALQVDDALDTIRSTTGKTGESLASLEGSFKSVASTVPVSLQQAADAVGKVHQATGATGSALEGLSTQLLNVSRLTGTDLSTNVTGAARLFGDWSIATKDQAGSLDFLFRTSQTTGAGFSALTEKLVQFGAPLRQMGFSFEESAALMGKWHQEGVNTELVLGSLRIAIGKFAAENVPLRAGLDATIAKIKELAPGSAATATAMEIFGRKAGPDMAAAILEGRFEIDGLLTTLKSGPETINRAAGATDGFKEKLTLLKTQATLALEPIGTRMIEALERLMPAFTTVAGWVATLAEKFANLSPTMQTILLGMGALVAAIGPVLVILGSLTTSVAAIVPWFAAGTTGAGLLSGAVTVLTGPIGLAAAAIGGLALALPKAIEGIRNLWAAWKEGNFIETLTKKDDDTWLRRWLGLSEGTRAAAEGLKTVSVAAPGAVAGVEQTTAALTGNAKAQVERADKTLFAADADKQAVQAAKALADQLKTLNDRVNGVDIVKQAKLWATALKEPGSEAKILSDTALRQELVTALDAVERKFGSLQAAGLGSIKKVHGEAKALTLTMEKVIALPKTSSEEWVKSAAAMNINEQMTGVDQIDYLPKMGNLFQPLKPIVLTDAQKDQLYLDAAKTGSKIGTSLTDPVIKTWDEKMATFGQGLAQSLIGAFQGGGNPIAAAGSFIGTELMTSLSKSLTTAKDGAAAALSGWLGGAAKAVLPFVGSLLGPLLGKVTEFLDGIFGNRGRDLVKDFAANFGGFDALHDKLLTLGAAGEQLWIRLTQGVGRNNPEQAKAAIDAVNAALGLQDERLSRAKEVLQEYGLTWEDAGEKYRNAQLAQQFDALFEKTQILKMIGVDYTTVLEKQSDQYSKLVQAAIRSGTEIPSAMKPVLADLARLGLLVDDAGKKFTEADVEGMTFAKTMTQGFDQVTAAIDRLTNALTRGVGGALDDLSRRQVRIPVKFDIDDLPDFSAPPRTYHAGTANVLPFPIIAHNGLLPDEVPAILQTGEAVLNRRAAAALGTRNISDLNAGRLERAPQRRESSQADASDGDTRLTIELDGMALWEGMIRSGKRAGLVA